MGRMQREKGARGELELCHKLTELFGFTAERTAQRCGNAGDSDVIVRETPNVFWESKREEKLSIHKAMNKAVEQAGGKLPVVCHRRNKTEWLLTVRLEDLMWLLQAVPFVPKDIPHEPVG